LSRTLLVDADIFAYVAASGTERVYHFDGAGSAPAVDENLEAGLEIAERDLEAVANKLKATKIIVCLTDDDNFRLGVYPQYKGNRAGVRRPSTLKAIKDFYAQKYETYQRPGLEADDCMGILSTHKTLVPGEKIIVSGDKDMQTIPGLLFNPKKDKAPRRISETEADRYFMQQTLTGDTTDGYPGCRGIGPKSPFVAALHHAGDLAGMWAHVVAAFQSKGFTPEDALVQARCARILRASDWDFAGRKPRLWTPPVSR
jgi:DNA polymerase-1